MHNHYSGYSPGLLTRLRIVRTLRIEKEGPKVHVGRVVVHHIHIVVSMIVVGLAWQSCLKQLVPNLMYSHSLS